MLLIFDCDGVVIDSMRLHNEVEAEAYRTIGIDIQPEELNRRFAGVPMAEELRILEQETGCKIPPDMGDRIDRRKESVFRERLRPIDGVHAMLDKLGTTPRCIASGTGTALLKFTLDLTKMQDRFAPHIYSSDVVARGKPFPDLFLHAAREMGIAPSDCLVIEDGVPGVQAGRAAGMRVFGFTGGSHCDRYHGDRLMNAGVDLVFSNMNDLPDLVTHAFMATV